MVNKQPFKKYAKITIRLIDVATSHKNFLFSKSQKKLIKKKKTLLYFHKAKQHFIDYHVDLILYFPLGLQTMKEIDINDETSRCSVYSIQQVRCLFSLWSPQR